MAWLEIPERLDAVSEALDSIRMTIKDCRAGEDADMAEIISILTQAEDATKAVKADLQAQADEEARREERLNMMEYHLAVL